MTLLLGAWLGGAACYTGVLLSPPRRGQDRLPLLGVAVLALCWPLAICFALGSEAAE